jgi:hypothetical protein
MPRNKRTNRLRRKTRKQCGGNTKITEGVDGCVIIGKKIPCSSNYEENSSSELNQIDAGNIVSKIVLSSQGVKEFEITKLAGRLLGEELSVYITKALGKPCKPASAINKNDKKKENSIKLKEEIQVASVKYGCVPLQKKGKEEKWNEIPENFTVMYFTRYDTTFSQWVISRYKENKEYLAVLQEIETAIPVFIRVLQRLYINDENIKLIHLDLHTKNIFVKLNPLGFGLSDFGNALVWKKGENEISEMSKAFEDYLVGYVSKVAFFPGYNQIPLEARLLSFCYQNPKRLYDGTTKELIDTWTNDSTIHIANSKDPVIHGKILINNLILSPLFIQMTEKIISICKKLREYVKQYNQAQGELFKKFDEEEKIVISFILTRYLVISSINAITEEVMNAYQQPIKDNRLVNFIISGIKLPYTATSKNTTLSESLKEAQVFDFNKLWDATSKQNPPRVS